MFSWEKFIDEVEIFPYAASRISYLRYNGICLYPYGYGTSIVGAYMESLETPSNKELARFFEAHGSTIISIFQAIEFGMDSSSEDNFRRLITTFHNNGRRSSTIIYHAFKKGLKYKEKMKLYNKKE